MTGSANQGRNGQTPPAVHARADLTANDIEVIRERHFGWEQAAPGTLAAIFGVSVQKINAVLNTRDHSPRAGGGIRTAAPALCSRCQAALCGCSDHAWGAAV